jgi:hypothetical protein
MNVETITSAILNKMSDTGKCQRRYILELVRLLASIRGRTNYVNLGRYGELNELTHRRNFAKPFNFSEFNSALVKANCSEKLGIIFDPSYISKSGKHTPGVGYFWSGSAGKMKRGLEIGALAIGDLENKTAMHFIAEQTIESESETDGLLAEYRNQIEKHSKSLLLLSKVLIVDAYFSKEPFITPIVEMGFVVVTRMRKDAHLIYEYLGPQKVGRGRPRIKGEKIDFKNLSTLHFTLFKQNDVERTKYYHGRAFVKCLGRWCSMVLLQKFDEKGKLTSTFTYISTDDKMSGEQVWEYYHNRFQIEFTFRDTKGFLGLEHSQSRNKDAISFHLNMCLTVLNILKAAHWLNIGKDKRPPFSIADIKTQYVNELWVNKFIAMFGIDPNTKENKAKIQTLYDFGKIAA